MKRLLLMLLLALVVPLATKAEVIEIGNGESMNIMPFHEINYWNWDEEIYPMSAFSAPCNINSISYNNVGVYGMMWPVPSMASSLMIYMGERESATHVSETDWTPLSNLTLVYSHENVVLGADCGWEEIVFDEPFPYELNGNLVVVVVTAYDNPAWDCNLRASSFADGDVSLFYESWSPGSPEFPGSGQLYSEFADIQFNVSPLANTCPGPKNLAVPDIMATSATLTWTAADGTNAWDVFISQGETPSAETTPTATAIINTNYTFSGLTPLTNYTAYVRSNCGDGDVSVWKSSSFMTSPDFGGSGTAEAPYLLYTKTDLEALTSGMAAGFETFGKYFKVMHDIEDVTSPIVGNFRGDFNGNNHTIIVNFEGEGVLKPETNQYGATYCLGLFAWICPNAYIHDLTLDGSIISSSENTGGFVAEINFVHNDGHDAFVSFSNLINKASIYSVVGNVGGVIGHADFWGGQELYLTNCTNKGSINSEGGGVGGIVGVTNRGILVDCENRGNITCTSSGGGICGDFYTGSFVNCANKGNITCSNCGGGIVGSNDEAIILNCYNVGALSGNTNLGGISGYNNCFTHIENCYNGGLITADNTANCGAIAGFNASWLTSICNNHYNYYNESTFEVAYGTEGDLSYTDNYTSFTQSGTSSVCTLAEPLQGTTDLLTALNNWRDGNEEYTQWYADTYGNNNYMPAFTEGTPPGLDISPNPFVMAPRPIGAWMQGELVTLVNTSQEDVQVTSVEFDNNYFLVDESAGSINLPIMLEGEQSQEVAIGTDPDATVSPGILTAQLSVTWNQTHVETAAIEVMNYTPVSPDVVELAEVVTSLPQTITQNTDILYDNYRLPGDKTDAPDAVYQLEFTEGCLFNAQVTTGSNAKLALYTVDFNGKPGPMVDNYYIGGNSIGGAVPVSMGGDDPITNLMVAPGTYYLVVSSTSQQFVVELSTDALPAPVAATLVAPADGATDITSPLELQWLLGQFTAEYQLLIGTSYPPSEVLVDWTSNLAESFTVDNLRNNQIYIWCVNERNATATTEGTPWHFTTTLNPPMELQADAAINVGDELLLHWTAAMRSLMGYNVYQDGVKINEELVTATEYTVTGLAYNMEGYSFTVTAVYDEGESEPSNAVVVRVGGSGTISGTVFEQDGVTGIAGATVNIIGYDEFYVRHSFVYLTDANGAYSGTVYSGRYVALAAKDGYQDGSHGSEIVVNYNTETDNNDIILYERYNPVGTVVAQFYPDTLATQSPNVKVYWESEDLPEPVVPGWHSYCNSEFNNAVSCVKWCYEYPLSVLAPYEGSTMTKVALFSDVMYGAVGGNYTCSIYVGGHQPEEGALVSTITVDVPSRQDEWVEYDLETPVNISGNESVWVIWQANTAVSDYPAGCCSDYNYYGTWCQIVYEGGALIWTHIPYGSWTMKHYFTNREGRTFTLSNEMLGGRSFQHYNVYRTSCYNDGPYTDENTVLLSSDVVDTVYLDQSWQEVEAGVYKYGVSRNYGGNRESGIKAYSFSRYSSRLPNGWIQYDPSRPLSTASVIDRNLMVYSGDYANDGFVHAFTEDNQLLTFDPGSGQIVAVVSTAYCMDDCAFDYSSNTMYGIKDNILYSVDLTTGVLTPIGGLDNPGMSLMLRALACSYSGQLYGFLENWGTLYSIDKTNGHCEEVGYSGLWLGDPRMSAGFDHSTGTLYWIALDAQLSDFIASVDVNTGLVTPLANGVGMQRAFCVPYGYTPTPTTPESVIVWSNCLDKDMWTTVEVSASTNTGASPEGTSIRFINLSEPDQGYDYMVTLNDSGYYNWDEFRKGSYNYTIEKDGYTSCGNHEIIEIWEPTSLECVLEEIALQARNLYVSPTGWAMWQEGLGGDVLHYDSDSFDGGVGASGTSFYWAVKFMGSQLEGFNKVTSVSFYDAPDQSFTGTFYICSTESPLGHVLYQKDIVTSGEGKYQDYPLDHDVEFDNSESLWIVFQFNGGEASYPASACSNTGNPNGRWISTNGLNWEDINSYGMNYTWKIRCHVKADGREEKQLEFYRVFLDDEFVGTTTDTYYQHEVENFAEGESHTTSVQAVYSSVESENVNYSWTYAPCEQYEGPTDFEVEDGNDKAVLNWSMPENQLSGGIWSFYDDGVNTGAVGAGGSSFYWGIMLPAGTWSGQYIGEVGVFDYAAFTGNILIYQGGDTAPDSLVYSQQYLSTGSGDYVEYLFNNVVELDESLNLWVVVNNATSASYPAAYCEDMGDPNARWISIDGSEWHDITEYDIQGTWMIRAYTTDEMPVVYNILGTMVFRDGELLTETPLARNVQTYVDNQAAPGQHDYSIRLVYDNLPIYQGDYYAMSCPETDDVTVGVIENESDWVNVYPNPVKDEVTIQAADMSHIRIVNALGQTVYDADIKADETRIPMGRFGSGVYVIHITTGNGTYAHRVVVSGR